MRKLILLLLISLFTLSSCARKEIRSEVYKTADGTSVTFKFFGHASLAIVIGGKWIYLDPVDKYVDGVRSHKATAIFITHSHADHLDAATVKSLCSGRTMIFCDRSSSTVLGNPSVSVMKPGKEVTLFGNMKVEAVPAYNTTAGHLQYHPKSREDCGYVFTIGGSKIYVAGDTENTPELKALKHIDVAFLPVNQPFTMTVDEAVDAVASLRPAVFYPYHYGGVEEKPDMDLLVEKTKHLTDIRIRNME